MATGNFQIALDLHSLYSSHLQTRTFYTIFLDVGQKQIELSHKRSPAQAGVIHFNQTLSLRLTFGDLKAAHNEGKLAIYSFYNYGSKKLFGNVHFKINHQYGGQQLKLKLTACSDDHAYLQFQSQINKMLSRVNSKKNSETNSSFCKLNYSTFEGHRDYIKPENLLFLQQEGGIDDLKSTQFMLPYKKSSQDHNSNPISISKNLQLMESFQAALKNLNDPNSTDLLKSQCNGEVKSSLKAKVFDKILTMSNALNQIHQKQDMLKNDDKIYQMMAQEDNRDSRIFQESQKQRNVIGSCDSFLAEHFKLKLQSHTVDFVYFDKNKTSNMRMPKTGSEGLHRLIGSIPSDEKDESMNEKQTIKKQVPSDKKMTVIRPKSRLQSFQEWQNDDNLVNIVHQMISDVKGNLGYVKLSKLTKLHKKINEMKNRNKTLIYTNQTLIQSYRLLTKKLEISQEIIKQKQKVLAVQFESLREQFKQVTKKLLEKYTQQIQRQNKIKQFQNQIQKYQTQVKQLQSKLQLKTRQAHHLRQLLASQEPSQKTQKEETLIDYQTQSKQKSQNISRNSSNKLFRSPNEKNLKYQGELLLGLEAQLESKKNIDMLKGISPNFADFFLTFIAKDEDTPKIEIQQPQHRMKRGRIYQKSQVANSQKSIQQMKNSSMFLEI